MSTTLRPSAYTILPLAQLTPRRIAELSGRDLDAHIEHYIFGRPITPQSPRWHDHMTSAVNLCSAVGVEWLGQSPNPALLSRVCLRDHIHRSTARSTTDAA